MSREAMQAGLDALKMGRIFLISREKIKQPEGIDIYDAAIARLEAALAAPDDVKLHAITDNGWCAWQYPTLREYTMICCDCGLSHDVEFDAIRTIEELPDGSKNSEILGNPYAVRLRMRRSAVETESS